MPSHERTEFNTRFYRELASLRLKIDLAPQAHRQQLHAFADTIDQQHRRMQDNCAKVRDQIDHLGQILASTKLQAQDRERESAIPAEVHRSAQVATSSGVPVGG